MMYPPPPYYYNIMHSERRRQRGREHVDMQALGEDPNRVPVSSQSRQGGCVQYILLYVSVGSYQYQR